MTEKKVQDIFIEGAIAASFIGESIAKHGNKTAIGAHSIFLGQVRSDAVDGNIVAVKIGAINIVVQQLCFGDIFLLNCQHATLR